MRSVLALAALLALAGCVTPAVVPPAPSAVAEAPAASLDVADAEPEPEADAAPPASQPTTVVVEGSARHQVHARVADAHAGISELARLQLPAHSPERATLVVTWESATPLEAMFEVWLLDGAYEPIAQGAGQSPIVLEVPGEAFGLHAALFGAAEPVAGAMVDGTLRFTLTVTYPASEA